MRVVRICAQVGDELVEQCGGFRDAAVGAMRGCHSPGACRGRPERQEVTGDVPGPSFPVVIDHLVHGPPVAESSLGAPQSTHDLPR